MNRRCLDCPALVGRGRSRCDACGRARQREKNAQFGGSGWAWQQTRERIMARDGGCVIDHEHAGPLSVDHIIPRSEGGTNDDANLRTLCKRAHDAATRELARRR